MKIYEKGLRLAEIIPVSLRTFCCVIGVDFLSNLHYTIMEKVINIERLEIYYGTQTKKRGACGLRPGQ